MLGFCWFVYLVFIVGLRFCEGVSCLFWVYRSYVWLVCVCCGFVFVALV